MKCKVKSFNMDEASEVIFMKYRKNGEGLSEFIRRCILLMPVYENQTRTVEEVVDQEDVKYPLIDKNQSDMLNFICACRYVQEAKDMYHSEDEWHDYAYRIFQHRHIEQKEDIPLIVEMYKSRGIVTNYEAIRQISVLLLYTMNEGESGLCSTKEKRDTIKSFIRGKSTLENLKSSLSLT